MPRVGLLVVAPVELAAALFAFVAGLVVGFGVGQTFVVLYNWWRE